jgi:hypothetical protein
VPLAAAWHANRRTSLFQAVHWAFAAWAAWLGTLAAEAFRPEDDPTGIRYLALSLTGCASVAVLGARRPGVGAWNFVVGGLLAVLLLPLVRGLEDLPHNPPQAVFLAATVAVGVLNYLPTRLAPAALLLAVGCGLDLFRLAAAGERPEALDRAAAVSHLSLALSPWAALAQLRRRAAAPSVFDAIWLDFRDRYGLFWAQRTREQFNRAAANAGWSVRLYWQGLRLSAGSVLPPDPVQAEMVETLRALLKRFGPA